MRSAVTLFLLIADEGGARVIFILNIFSMESILTPANAQVLGSILRAMAMSIENMAHSEGNAIAYGTVVETVEPQVIVEPSETDSLHTHPLPPSGSSSFLRGSSHFTGGINFALYGVVSGLMFRRYASTLFTSLAAGVGALIAIQVLGYGSVKWKDLICDTNHRASRLLHSFRRRPSLIDDRSNRNRPPEVLNVIVSKPFLAGFLGSLFL